MIPATANPRRNLTLLRTKTVRREVARPTKTSTRMRDEEQTRPAYSVSRSGAWPSGTDCVLMGEISPGSALCTHASRRG
jgi:hypothetical protein